MAAHGGSSLSNSRRVRTTLSTPGLERPGREDPFLVLVELRINVFELNLALKRPAILGELTY